MAKALPIAASNVARQNDEVSPKGGICCAMRKADVAIQGNDRRGEHFFYSQESLPHLKKK
jgi:hypothetical protein